MPKLYNNETGQIEDVPFQEVNNAIESGTYGFQAGPAVPLENPSGEVYLMPADKAAEIIQDHSWRFPSQEKTTNFFNDLQKDVAKADEEARLEEEYGDAPLQAGFFGATRGLTLGLSDPLWRSLGVSAERLRELEERQPGISTTAEIGGALVPLLLPEPTSSTGAAARLGLLAARGVTGASAQAGKVAARALGKKIAGQAGKQTLARAAAPLALGGAVEGALYGIGETISEDALENKEMSAEAFVGNIGIGTLLGGAGGVLLGGGKEIIQRSARSRMAARLLDERQARDFKRRVLENAQQAGRRVSLNDPRPLLQIMDSENIIKYAPRNKKGKITHGGFGRAIKDKIVSGASLITGADKKLMDEFFSSNPEAQKLRKWAFASSSERMNLAGMFRREVEKMYKQTDRMVKQLTGGEKYAQMRKMLKGDDVTTVRTAVEDMLERFIVVIDDMKAQGDIYMYKPAIARIEGALFGGKGFGQGLAGRIANAKTSFDIFKTLDKTKKLMVDPHLKFGRNLQPTEAETINQLVRSIRLPIKNMLENPRIFGDAGRLQRRINKAASDYMDFLDMFQRNFTLKRYVKGRPVYDVDDNKIVSFLNMRGRFHATSSPRKLTGPGGMNELIEQQQKISAIAEGLTPETQKFRKIISGDEGGEFQQMDDIIDFFTEHNALRQKSWDELVLGKDRMIMKEGMTGLQKSIDGISERLAQMQENWAAQFKLRDLAGGSKTQTTISTIQKAEEVLKSTKDKMKRSVLNMIKPAAKGAKAATRAAKAEGSAMEGGVKLTEELKGRKPKTPEEEQESFKKETDEISQLKADPSLMISRLGINLDELSMAAPEVAMNVTQTAQRAIEYAYKNIPTSPLNGEVLSDNFQPSREQLYRWRTVMRAIEDPMVITDQIASGFIVPKTLEAVQEVYPEMLNELRKITLEEAAKQPKISIQQQMLISQVMGVAGPYRKMTPGLQATYQQPIGTGLQRRTNKVQNLDRLFKTPVQGIA
jgi:hypothetical protein